MVLPFVHLLNIETISNFLLDAALHNGGRPLDVGCGPGLMLLQLAASYPTLPWANYPRQFGGVRSSGGC
jgi:ubiquinone/menaquinone biosynthesis C-methylase UbiE